MRQLAAQRASGALSADEMEAALSALEAGELAPETVQTEVARALETEHAANRRQQKQTQLAHLALIFRRGPLSSKR